MSTEQGRKSTPFSRWRERRRLKAQRASEIQRKVKEARSSRSHDGRGGGDSGAMGGGIGAGGI